MTTIRRVFSLVPLFALAVACSGVGGDGSSDLSPSTGGTAAGGSPLAVGGSVATGGVAPVSGGSSAGGAAAGGASSGGSAAGGAGAGGAGAGGSPASGGAAAGGGLAVGGSETGGAGSGGASMGGALPMGNPPVKSAGCGKATTITSKEYTISSSGKSRIYYVEMPANYDMNKPYRLFYTSHWINSKYQDVKNQDYYFLKPLIEADGEQAIFVAPTSDDGTWDQIDHALFDDILALLKENVCFDETRVFATGFSFGGMITYSLSTNHQADIRAAVGIAPANYNIWLPEKTHKPIAWMHTTGLTDGTCPWVNNEQQERGAKFIAIEKAEDNGCTIPAEIPTRTQGQYLCYDFEDCDPGYPTRVCTFAGGHTNIDGNPNWIPIESWKFFKQF